MKLHEITVYLDIMLVYNTRRGDNFFLTENLMCFEGADEKYGFGESITLSLHTTPHASRLRLNQLGIPKDHMSLLAVDDVVTFVPQLFLDWVSPFFVTRFTAVHLEVHYIENNIYRLG